MILWVRNLLTPAELASLREALASAPFEDGKATVGVLARAVKQNEEVAARSGERQELGEMVLQAVRRNQTVEAGIRPKKFVTPIFNRYRPGMHYGSHLDNAMMGREERVRVDVSMTLFLSDPESYDGGELSIDTEYGPRSVKLPAGDAVFYPTAYYHEVKPVTRGERLACVTWIQSLVRAPHRRQILYELSVLGEWIHSIAPTSPQYRQFNKVQHNLYREWADD